MRAARPAAAEDVVDVREETVKTIKPAVEARLGDARPLLSAGLDRRWRQRASGRGPAGAEQHRSGGYPRILPDNRVVFQVRAPKAGRVQVNLGRLYDMQKDEAGVWTVTTAPQDPGFHYYSLVDRRRQRVGPGQ